MENSKRETQQFLKRGNHFLRQVVSDGDSGVEKQSANLEAAKQYYLLAYSSAKYPAGDEWGELLLLFSSLADQRLQELKGEERQTNYLPAVTVEEAPNGYSSVNSLSRASSSSILSGSTVSNTSDGESRSDLTSGRSTPASHDTSISSPDGLTADSLGQLQVKSFTDETGKCSSNFKTKTGPLNETNISRAPSRASESETVLPNSTENDDDKWKRYFLEMADASCYNATSFEGIVGLGSIKALLITTLFGDQGSLYSHLVKSPKKKRPNILFYGYPGCGKTELVKAYVGMMKNTTLFPISASDLMSKWIGESERKLKALLHVAEQRAPSVIFIDEVDSLLGGEKENKYTTNFVSEFLIRVETLDNVQVLAATNYPWRLHSSVLRRSNHVLNVPLPNRSSRMGIIKRHLGPLCQHLSSKDLLEISRITESYSPSDLKRALDYAAVLPLIVTQRANYFKKVGTGEESVYVPCHPLDKIKEKLDFADIPAEKVRTPTFSVDYATHAMRVIKPSVDPNDGSVYNKNMKEFHRKFGHNVSCNPDALLVPAVARGQQAGPRDENQCILM